MLDYICLDLPAVRDQLICVSTNLTSNWLAVLIANLRETICQTY
jgi:hypothetical protein